jgi:hypothetical protein
MMRLVLIGLVGIAGLAVWTTHRHYAARDAERAVVRLMTHRFDGTTRSRLNDWLRAQALRTSTVPDVPGPFADAVRIDLRIDSKSHYFLVPNPPGKPTPDGTAARALVDRMLADVAAESPRK